MASSDKFKSMHAVFEIRKGEQFHRDRHLFVEQHAVPLPHSWLQQHLKITAPGNSPDTDGMHISTSDRIKVFNCVIGTGDNLGLHLRLVL